MKNPELICPFCEVVHETAELGPKCWVFVNSPECPLFHARFEGVPQAEETMVMLKTAVSGLLLEDGT